MRSTVSQPPFEQAWCSPWPDTNRDPLAVISFSTSYMKEAAHAMSVALARSDGALEVAEAVERIHAPGRGTPAHGSAPTAS